MTPAECQWSGWGNCNATCVEDGFVPETVTGTKRRSVLVDGLKCDGDNEDTCEKKCPGKQSGFELNVISNVGKKRFDVMLMI